MALKRKSFIALDWKHRLQNKFQLGNFKDDFFIILFPIMSAVNAVNYDASRMEYGHR
jgi:hypothetical protein